MINDHITEEEVIHLDSGFFFGLGVFETILVKNNQPILLKEHLDRLNAGLKILNINKYIEEEYTRDQIKRISTENCAIKITVSDKNTLFSKREIIYQKEDYQKGFSLKISNIRRNPRSHITYIKSTNYIDNMLEKQKATEEGFHEVVFLNNENEITEGSMTNLFFVKENKIYTPLIECGLLAGVLRSWIINNYEVIQGHYTLEEVKKSDGVFVTNSLVGIMKVVQIEDAQVNTSAIVNEIQIEYRKFLEVNNCESEN
jgi:4-amino-4-deoxychorismate lyase